MPNSCNKRGIYFSLFPTSLQSNILRWSPFITPECSTRKDFLFSNKRVPIISPHFLQNSFHSLHKRRTSFVRPRWNRVFVARSILSGLYQNPSHSYRLCPSDVVFNVLKNINITKLIGKKKDEKILHRQSSQLRPGKRRPKQLWRNWQLVCRRVLLWHRQSILSLWRRLQDPKPGHRTFCNNGLRGWRLGRLHPVMLWNEKRMIYLFIYNVQIDVY